MRVCNNNSILPLKDYLLSLWLDVNLIKDEDLLMTAFVHKSYSSDFKEMIVHNERLEFLWDAILWFIIAKLLFLDYPGYEESKLTLYKIALIREETLAEVALSIKLNEYICLSNWEERAWWRFKAAIVSDALEAFIGYIYLDMWVESVEFFIKKYIYSKVNNLSMDIKSSKSELQELIQKKYKVLPDYEDIESEIDSKWNVKKYLTIVRLNGQVLWEGTWTSKKKAQETAAKKALNKIKKIDI